MIGIAIRSEEIERHHCPDTGTSHHRIGPVTRPDTGRAIVPQRRIGRSKPTVKAVPNQKLCFLIVRTVCRIRRITGRSGQRGIRQFTLEINTVHGYRHIENMQRIHPLQTVVGTGNVVTKFSPFRSIQEIGYMHLTGNQVSGNITCKFSCIVRIAVVSSHTIRVFGHIPGNLQFVPGRMSFGPDFGIPAFTYPLELSTSIMSF